VGRRMLYRDLTRGFTAWCAMWQARTCIKQQLRGGMNRLWAPALSDAFVTWVSLHQRMVEERLRQSQETAQQSHEAEMARVRREAEGRLRAMEEAHVHACKELEEQLRATQEAQQLGFDRQLVSLTASAFEQEAGLSQARFEISQLEIVKSAQEDELRELRDRTQAQAQKLEAMAAESGSAAEMHARGEALVESNTQLQSDLVTAEERLRAKEHEAATQHETNRKLMDDLLAEQRRRFEGQLAKCKEELAGSRQARSSLLADLQMLKREQRETRDELSSLREQEKMRRAAVAAAPAKKAEPPKRPKNSTIFKLDLDEGPGSRPISEQLAGALRANSGRVLDLFRDWDKDGDGEVSHDEFRRAMPLLGLEVPIQDIDALFTAWDKDGGGALSLAELTKILRSKTPPPVPGDPSQATSLAGGATAGLAAQKLKRHNGK